MGLCHDKMGSSHVLLLGLKCCCWGLMVLFLFWTKWCFLFLSLSHCFIPLLSSACLPPSHISHICPLYWWPLLGIWSEYTVSSFHVSAPVHMHTHKRQRLHFLNPTMADNLKCVSGAFYDKIQSPAGIHGHLNHDIQMCCHTICHIAHFYICISCESTHAIQSLAIQEPQYQVSCPFYYFNVWLSGSSAFCQLMAGWHLNDGTCSFCSGFICNLILYALIQFLKLYIYI